MSQNSTHTTNMVMDIENGNSVLLTFGKPGRTLKRKIALTGFICRVVFFLIFNPIFLTRVKYKPNLWKRRKASAMKVMRLFFPFYSNECRTKSTDHGQVIVINHPTLNDPICAILYAVYSNPDCEVIVPVNLPWYESICRYRIKLSKLGIKIVPILTPETALRLGPSEDDSAARVQAALMKNYVAEFTSTLACGGIAIVAQQATRKRYVFNNVAQSETGNDILSTISLILVAIRRSGLLEQAIFTPVGVVPHKIDAKAKLNPFRKYTLNVGEPILAADLAAIKNAAKRPADLYILRRLLDLLPIEYHFENQPYK